MKTERQYSRDLNKALKKAHKDHEEAEETAWNDHQLERDRIAAALEDAIDAAHEAYHAI